MSLTAVIILIIVGLLLVLVEFFILPGTNIAGIIGIILIIGAVYFSYRDLGTPIAHYILAGSVLLMAGSIFGALRSNTWSKLSLTSTIDGKMVNVEPNQVAPGDKGITLTRLNPMGKVMINSVVFEGSSRHHFIDQNTPIEVIKVSGNQIIVKPIE
jgi:membrane-bound ClpP family serine protease